jgi:PGDYG protein
MNPRYRRISKSFWVDFATQAGTVSTLEGPVAHQAGDAIVLGLAGERWPVDLASFKKLYLPSGPVDYGQAGYYQRRPQQVNALRLEGAQDIQTARGSLHAKVGDWRVETLDGQVSVVASELFHHLYQPLGLQWQSLLGTDDTLKACRWLEAGQRTALMEDLCSLDQLTGKKLTPYVALAAGRVLERLMGLHPKVQALPRDSEGAVLKAIDLLAMSGCMSSGEAAAAHNLRNLGNDARHMRRHLDARDEPFIQSLLCVLLAWALGERHDTQILDAAPLLDVVALVRAHDAATCAQAFANLVKAVDAHGEHLMLFAIERSLDLGDLNVARQLIDAVAGSHGEGLSKRRRFRQLKALWLSRSGQLREALDLIGLCQQADARRRDLDPLYEDTQGIAGGIHKRAWIKHGDAAHLHRAREAYQRAWDAGHSFYPGVNLAAVLAWSGHSSDSERVARSVVQQMALEVRQTPKESDLLRAPWLYLTQAEACWLSGDHVQAQRWHDMLKGTLSVHRPGMWKTFELQWEIHQNGGRTTRPASGRTAIPPPIPR